MSLGVRREVVSLPLPNLLYRHVFRIGDESNSKFKMKKSKFQFKIQNLGFTLVELLVVISLLGIIGAVTTQVFILGFRSQAKSEILKEVKQNGDYAISVMENMIRNASDIPQSLAQCNTSLDSLTIVNPDGYTTTFECVTVNPGVSSIASVSGDPDGLPLPGPTLALTSNRVIIPTPLGGGYSCTFRVVCPTPPLSPKYIFLTFTVMQAALAGQPTPLPENRSTLDFQTTVSLRTYE